jgi:hypothetical protein
LIPDQVSVLLGSSLLLTHTMLRLYRSLYINVNGNTTQDLVDYTSPYLYFLFSGLTLLVHAPDLGTEYTGNKQGGQAKLKIGFVTP